MITTITVVSFVAISIWLGTLGNTSDPNTPPDNQSNACDDLCSDLRSKATNLCQAISNRDAAERYVDRLQEGLDALLKGSIGLAVAILGTLASTGKLPPVAAIILAGAIAVALALGVVVAGVGIALVTAQVILNDKNEKVASFRESQVDAENKILDSCAEVGQQCIDSLAPC